MAEHDDRKAALIAELERARSRMTAHRRELAEDVDVPAKLKASVSGHRGIWIGAATLIGLVVTQLPRRTKKVVIHKGVSKKEVERAGMAGLALAGLKFLFSIVRPMLISWATKRLGDSVNGRNYNSRDGQGFSNRRY